MPRCRDARCGNAERRCRKRRAGQERLVPACPSRPSTALPARAAQRAAPTVVAPCPRGRRAPRAAPAPRITLTDVTREAGITARHDNGAAGRKLLPETMGAGAAFLDFDNDSHQDLLLVQRPVPRGRRRPLRDPLPQRRHRPIHRHQRAGWTATGNRQPATGNREPGAATGIRELATGTGLGTGSASAGPPAGSALGSKRRLAASADARACAMAWASRRPTWTTTAGPMWC